MAHRNNQNDDDLISDINIVPFVDILLVVLIIFMVTAPVVMRPSLKVHLPEASSGEKSQFTPFQIVIQAKGEITLNGKPITFEQIKNAAISFKEQNPEGQAIISADQSVPHGDVISILDQVKLGGIRRLGLSIKNK